MVDPGEVGTSGPGTIWHIYTIEMMCEHELCIRML